MPKKTRPRVRINPIARAPILRKGGAHQKTRSAKRQAEKHELRQWINKAGAGDTGPADPPFYVFKHNIC